MALLQEAREHVERMVEDLEGEDDFMPFLLYRGAKDREVMAAMEMPDEEYKDALADMMTAMLAAYRATEAVFCSVSWAVTGAKQWSDILPERHPDKEAGPMQPSECPDRREIVFLLYVTPDFAGMHSANITRCDGRVQLGPWEMFISAAETRFGGRFANAISRGIDLGRNMPEEMCAFIDERMDGREDEFMGPLLRALARWREVADAE